MKIAIMNMQTGAFLHTATPKRGVVQDANGINRRADEPLAERKLWGGYDFVEDRGEAPPGKKHSTTSYAEDHEAGAVTEVRGYRDMTDAELKAANNDPLDARIDALERQQLLPRITRDMHRMVTLREAATMGYTEANLLDPGHQAYSPGYVRFMAFDAEIAALRSQRR